MPRKGTTGQCAARRIKAFLRDIAAVRTDVITSSGGEAAIKSVAGDVAVLRPSVSTLREEAPRGSSGSHEIVEWATHSVVQQTRVLKHWLQDKLGKIPAEHPRLP